MRTAARVDANQREIIRILRDCGVTVQPLHTVGKGTPDLLCGYRGRNVLLEVKDGNRYGSRLTDAQQAWHRSWRGQVAVIDTADDALRILGVI
ncbi:MAG: hypothetical protein DWQ08_01345 [Proteobacteria bacterium]|nr:MAG: hypothetical protein DWQ08_01345 [Pseudomonadota bacterium]